MVNDLYWLTLAVILVHRCLIAGALSPARIRFSLAACLCLLTGSCTASLAGLAAVDLRVTLQNYGMVVGILICVEAWLFASVLSRRAYFSPFSWAAIVYLQARLFQSGYLPAAFDIQTLVYATALVSLLFLLPGFASTLSPNYLTFHAVMIWLVTGVGLHSWPQIAGVDSQDYLSDTALLLAVLPLFLVVSAVGRFAWLKLYRALGGV